MIATAPVTVVQQSQGEGLGYVILLLPLASTILIWVWVGSMNLLQDPATSLSMLGCVTILATAVLMAVEASSLGMGKDPVENGRKGTGPIAWFVGTLMLWLVAFPLYLHSRRWYGRKSLVVGGLVVAFVFTGSWWSMSSNIETAKSSLRERFQNVP